MLQVDARLAILGEMEDDEGGQQGRIAADLVPPRAEKVDQGHQEDVGLAGRIERRQLSTHFH